MHAVQLQYRIIIAQFPIENHSEQGQFAESPLKTMGKVQNLGDYYAFRSSNSTHRSEKVLRLGPGGKVSRIPRATTSWLQPSAAEAAYSTHQ